MAQCLVQRRIIIINGLPHVLIHFFTALVAVNKLKGRSGEQLTGSIVEHIVAQMTGKLVQLVERITGDHLLCNGCTLIQTPQDDIIMNRLIRSPDEIAVQRLVQVRWFLPRAADGKYRCCLHRTYGQEEQASYPSASPCGRSGNES